MLDLDDLANGYCVFLNLTDVIQELVGLLVENNERDDDEENEENEEGDE